jgi:hypothetical protein
MYAEGQTQDWLPFFSLILSSPPLSNPNTGLGNTSVKPWDLLEQGLENLCICQPGPAFLLKYWDSLSVSSLSDYVPCDQ